MQNTSLLQCLFIALGLLFFLIAVKCYETEDQQLWSAFSIIFGLLAFRQQAMDNEEEMES